MAAAAARNRARGYWIPLAFAGCVLLACCQLALASPLPQSPSTGLDVGNRASYPANDSSLEDPFSTPDYLGKKALLHISDRFEARHGQVSVFNTCYCLFL